MTRQKKADMLLVLITGFWGCSYYLSDLALEEMPPSGFCGPARCWALCCCPSCGMRAARPCSGRFPRGFP